MKAIGNILLTPISIALAFVGGLLAGITVLIFMPFKLAVDVVYDLWEEKHAEEEEHI